MRRRQLLSKILEMLHQSAIHRGQIVVIFEHPLPRDDRAELHVLARRTEEDLQREEVLRGKFRLRRIFVRERLLPQIEELDRDGFAAQSTFHRRSGRCGHNRLLFASCVDQSQDNAPADWYSVTRVSKKFLSLPKSIVSLIQGGTGWPSRTVLASRCVAAADQRYAECDHETGRR